MEWNESFLKPVMELLFFVSVAIFGVFSFVHSAERKFLQLFCENGKSFASGMARKCYILSSHSFFVFLSAECQNIYATADG